MTEYELFCQQQHARHLMDVVNKQNTEKLEQRIKELEVTVSTLNNALSLTSAGNKKLEQALDVALEALENSAVKHPQQIPQRDAAIKLLREVRREAT